VGKSTLFNLLTGLNQHVGNWPGKTVEFRQGFFTYAEHPYNLVDLPGTYSLTANSPEEVIAREYIMRHRPDAVIAVVNAASLERSLYLVAELICLPAPLVIALNMMDVAEQEGMQVDARVLEAALGVPVVPITASRALGISDLLQKVELILSGEIVSRPNRPEIRPDHRAILAEVEKLVIPYVPDPYPVDWVALKLLEGDAEVTRMMAEAIPADAWHRVQGILRQHDDALLAVASGRYEWIGRMIRAAVAHPRLGQISLTERLDRYAAHPIWGLVILAVILGVMFWLTFAIGAPIQGWLDEQVVGRLSSAASRWLAQAPDWLNGLVANSLIGGVGSVLTFLPILVIFFATFGVLEDVGYMARSAYVMDNLMHLMGLHGRSFLPLFLGFGCNVPAVMGTRVIDSKPARLLTIVLAPLVPCTARLAVVAFLAPAFFGTNAVWVAWGIVLLSLGILVASGALLNRMLFKGQRSAFIMEMPLYHLPNARTVGLLVWQRSLSFVKKAGTIILLFSVGTWALAMLPGGNLESSYLASLGKFLEPVGGWLGFDWRLTVALITSFPAKENAVATLGILFGSNAESGLAQTLAATYSPASALSFLVVTILFIPCAATVAVIRQETGSWRWTLFSLLLLLCISLAAGVITFQAGRLLGL
jgi:ferrous iron transport protein B